MGRPAAASRYMPQGAQGQLLGAKRTFVCAMQQKATITVLSPNYLHLSMLGPASVGLANQKAQGTVPKRLGPKMSKPLVPRAVS